ncbi:MAG: hypothetical protein HY744_15275 [Deltaproteobacteria bacterium]|nr:hypothetical protein [Deltaproteobacteria bacterium]
MSNAPPGGWGQPPGGGWGAPMPPPGMPPGHVPDGGGAAPRMGGVPWESGQGNVFGRWWGTLKAADFEGRPFFAATVQTDNGIPAATFNAVSGAIFGFAVGLFYFLLTVVAGATSLVSGISGKAAGAGAAAAGMSVGIGIFYLVAMTGGQAFNGFIAPWLGGGIHHVLLMLFAGIGPGRTYGHTVRAFGYGMGAAMPWVAIPGVGGIIALVFAIKNLVQGYDEVHHCGAGKALAAMFAPVLCCCACYGVAFAIWGSVIMSALFAGKGP